MQKIYHNITEASPEEVKDRTLCSKCRDRKRGRISRLVTYLIVMCMLIYESVIDIRYKKIDVRAAIAACAVSIPVGCFFTDTRVSIFCMELYWVFFSAACMGIQAADWLW